MTREEDLKEMEAVIRDILNPYNDKDPEVEAWLLVEDGWHKQKTGTWRLETDEEEPNPMFKHVVCSNCGGTSGTTFKFCPHCGTKMFKED